MFEPQVESMSRDELADLQSRRLRQLVQRAYEKVPFYRRKMESRGLVPQDIRSIADIRYLPTLQKSDMREQYPFGLFSAEREEIARFHASSGTKGKPTLVGYTAHDLQVFANLLARSLVTAGATPQDTIHVAYGYGLFTGGLGFHAGVEHLGATVVPASSGQTVRQVTLMQDLRPQGICCTPSYAMTLADVMLQHSIQPKSLGIRYGIFGAEPWSESMRKQIEDIYGLTACDVYGLSELMGPGVAIECFEEQNGLHLAEDHFYAEICHPDTGDPVPESEYGELVLTALSKEAMAIIRYRTGDITRLKSEPCSCGRTHRRMERLLGRRDDMLVVRGVNVYPSEIERVILECPELSAHYQIRRVYQGHLEQLEVHVEVADSSAASVELAAAASFKSDAFSRQVAEKLYNTLGIKVEVKICPPGTLPRSEGKAVRLVEERHS
ncbi:phenylacetate--CoA ligase family protein [Alicyclobacillus tolerans]|uniref:phenylacetate--CoA ligase family protein n=1 Tax=Alicyclobacillus tolerans TaxID=90970 RepID=UPI003B813B44